MVVTLDLDGTLFDFPGIFSEKLSLKTNKSFKPSSMKHYSYKAFLPKALHGWAETLLKDPDFYLESNVIDGSKEFVKKLACFCDVYVITARPNSLREMTEFQVRSNFPEIKDIFIANYKCPIAQEIGSQFHLDDDPWWAISMAAQGINAALYSQPYNQELNVMEYPHMYRIDEYSQFLQLISSQYKEHNGGRFNISPAKLIGGTL